MMVTDHFFYRENLPGCVKTVSGVGDLCWSPVVVVSKASNSMENVSSDFPLRVIV